MAMHSFVVLFCSLAQYVVCTSHAIAPGTPFAPCCWPNGIWNGLNGARHPYLTSNMFAYRSGTPYFPILASNIIGRLNGWISESRVLLFFVKLFIIPSPEVHRWLRSSMWWQSMDAVCTKPTHQANSIGCRRWRRRRLLWEGKADVGLKSGWPYKPQPDQLTTAIGGHGQCKSFMNERNKYDELTRTTRATNDMYEYVLRCPLPVARSPCAYCRLESMHYFLIFKC